MHHNLRHGHPRPNFPWRANLRYGAPFPGRNPTQYNHVRWNQPQHSNNKEEHWCETCDRGFPSIDLLEKHKQQHQKCNIDGCQFVAHPKVITKHIQMQHSSGLYKKIAKLVNPEEIQKWREERKKKYPTKENIGKKEAEKKEKVERGEKMGMARDRRHNAEFGNKRKFNENYEKRQPHNKFNKTNPSPVIKKPRREPKVAPSNVEKSKLAPFTGIQHIVMESYIEENEEDSKCSFLIDDDDDCEETSINTKNNTTENANTPNLCGALSSLVGDYGSSDDETSGLCSEPVMSIKTVNNKIYIKDVAPDNETIKLAIEENKNESDDDSAPEEVKVVKNETESTTDQNTTSDTGKRMDKHVKFQKKQVQVNQQKYIKRKPKLPSTLLQKLLAKEVQHERNIVLQCIRYITNNNYFDK